MRTCIALQTTLSAKVCYPLRFSLSRDFRTNAMSQLPSCARLHELVEKRDGACRYQGEMKANFLRHEGFLGAVGAFLKVHPMAPASTAAAQGREPRKAHVKPTPTRVTTPSHHVIHKRARGPHRKVAVWTTTVRDIGCDV